MRLSALLLALVLGCWPAASGAQTRSSSSGDRNFERAESEDAELELKLQNPISDLVLLQFLTTVDAGLGDLNLNRTTISAQALIPIRILANLNLVAWTQVPLQSLPPLGDGGDRVNGIGDTIQYTLLQPARLWRIVWGFGPVTLLPTATREALGSGMFALGPAAVVSYQDERWTLYLLAHHLLPLGSSTGRPDVERTFLKPILSYTFRNGVNLALESETMADWSRPKTARWTVPLQAGISRVTRVGALPLNLQLGARWYVERPAGGPDWGLRLAVSFVIPIHRDEEEQREGEEEGAVASPD